MHNSIKVRFKPDKNNIRFSKNPVPFKMKYKCIWDNKKRATVGTCV